MRKTLNINLGGMAFIIDENAFDLLHTYLEAVKRKFNNEAERTEIMNDIEARMAELLNQRLQNRKEVIGFEDVQFITDAMGKPEDIAGEETETTASANSQNTASAAASAASSSPDGTVKKRLFRDPDDAKIGGVISGLCHYFGIQDPVWARIAALILIFITSGTVILVYLLLLVIIPKAQTAAEKLQMKGEPVNINTIEKEIKDAANRAGESVHKFVKDQNIFERIWDAFLSVLRVFSKIFAVLFITCSVFSLIVVIGCFIACYVMGSTQYNEVTHLLVGSGSVIRLFSFGLLLFLATPFIALTYLGLKMLLGQRSRVRWLKWALFGSWVVGLALLCISSFKVLTYFGVPGTSKIETTLIQPARGILYVRITDTTGKKLSRNWEDNNDEEINLMQGQVTINGVDFSNITRISIGKPMLELMPSENDSFYIQEIITARGLNKNDAVKNAEMVVYSFAQTDTVLNLNSNMYINKTGKWRNQKMMLRIAIPIGKQIRFADNIDLWSASVKGDPNYDDTYFANTVWTVEDGKVKCIAGENHKNATADDPKSNDKRTIEKVEKKLIRVHDKLDKSEDKENKGNDDKDNSDEDF